MKETPRHIFDSSLEMVDSMQELLSSVEQKLDKRLDPVRNNALQRFPTLFLMITTLGLVLVIYAIEQIFAQWQWIQNSPWLALLLGISILFATGSLYKKLS